jgi:energy-coupling factor transporter ATP-binding protein EcfA2
MISSMRLTNFQGFQGPHEIRLSKINLIFGPNSSGKSSILRALRFMNAQLKPELYVGKPGEDDFLETNGLKFKEDSTLNLEVSLDFDTSARFNGFQLLHDPLVQEFGRSFSRFRVTYSDEKLATRNGTSEGEDFEANLTHSTFRPLDLMGDSPWILGESHLLSSENLDHEWWFRLFGEMATPTIFEKLI